MDQTGKHDHCMLYTSDYKLFEHFLVLICMGQEAETALINALTLAVKVCFFLEYMNCEAK
jgi:hypothetical protein